MSQRSLLDEVPFEPDLSLGEPIIWIQRLVLLESLDAEEPLQDIEFRRGLNIIATEQAKPGDEKPIGHDVGKTMLVRIIRYLLGEEHYGDQSLQSNVAAKLPGAYAIGQFRVAGTTWCVSRPLGLNNGPSSSWCAITEDIDTLRTSDGHQKYRGFVAALNTATKKCYTSMALPHADKRPAEWKDLLGWLSRDQGCHFRHHAEWRVSESQAGPRVLKKEDSHLVMRMGLGLLRDIEIQGLNELENLRSEFSDREFRHRSLEAVLDQSEADLRSWLGDRDLAESDIPSGGFFGTVASGHAEEKIKSLENLLGDVLDAPDIQRLEKELATALGEQGAAQRHADDLDAKEQTFKETLAELKEQDDESFLLSLGTKRWQCAYWPTDRDAARAAGCPGETPAKTSNNGMDPRRAANIRLMEQEIEAIQPDIVEAKEQLDQANAKVNNARAERTAAVTRQMTARDGILTEISSWRETKRQAELYRTRWEEFDTLDRVLLEKDSRLRTARDGLSEARKEIADDLAKLSICYSMIVRMIISPNAQGSVVVDGNGIRPIVRNASSQGTTLQTCGRVLAYDLACLAASITGVGYLPRLWMHDSPRAADTEDALYHRLMDVAGWLENAFGEDLPTFQHIWTTTSLPPEHLDCEPYVRLRLNGRGDNGEEKLLRCDFGK